MSTPPWDPTERGPQGQQRVDPGDGLRPSGRNADAGAKGGKDVRTTAAESLDKLAGSAKAAATQLEGDDVGQVSRYVSELADSMTRFSASLRDKSGDEILGDVARLARENPALFVTGSVAIGFALTRFARASHAQPGSTAQHDESALAASGSGLHSSPTTPPASGARTSAASTGSASFDAARSPGTDQGRPGTPRGGIH